ncbi:MAG: hypothetical protein HKN00_04810 [Flavobacteriaceae bacterium]|nr:hypothetical protein [Bacteroidia bacterium]MBT8288637.1 hypothetical protein [Bacteroidia bacterium]NNF74483.1 hypothetical protein [Flavobacteriaceae bacterium]NNK72526.1 hypothetical protein [Flavobacteriaceae bacterium]
MILVVKYLLPRGYMGLTIYPFILLKNKRLKQDKFLINHERIHLRQQLELLIIPFFLIYLIEFTVRFIQYRNWHLAYKNISFEREAYMHEANLDYLSSRPFWKCFKYV